MKERNQRGITGRRDRVFRITDALLNGLYENPKGSIQTSQTAWFYAVDYKEPYLGWRGMDWLKLSVAD